MKMVGNSPYKSTHKNHPCVKWAEKSSDNFLWLKNHGCALLKEYSYRYNKIHKCSEIIKNIEVPLSLPNIGLTDFVKAMPEPIKSISDPVEAYKEYYRKHKYSIAKYTKREVPLFMKEVTK